MEHFKLRVLNMFLIAATSILVVAGLIIVVEFPSSAADDINTVVKIAVEAPRPVAPQREITLQRTAPLDLDGDLPPFWSR